MERCKVRRIRKNMINLVARFVFKSGHKVGILPEKVGKTVYCGYKKSIIVGN